MQKITISENQVAVGKSTSNVFRVQSQDIGHLYSDDRRIFFADLKTSLCQLMDRETTNNKVSPRNTSNYFYKLYSLGSETLLSTNDPSPHLHGFDIFPEMSPIESVFGIDNFYSEIVFEKDYFILNGVYYRFVNLYSMPESLSPNDLPSFGEYFLLFRKYPRVHAESVLDRMRKIHTSKSNSSKFVSDVKSEMSQADSEDMYYSLLNGEGLFDVAQWYVIKATNKFELEANTKELISNLKWLRCEPLIETIALKSLVEIFIPGPGVDFRRSHLATAEYLANMIPFMSERVHKNGVSFATQIGGQVFVDIFDKNNMNYNAVYTGVSGAGKSALNQKFIFEMIQNGASAVLIDWGYSYKKITNYFEGNTFSEKFNPMQFRSVEYLKAFILSAIPTGELTHKQHGHIYELIKKFLVNDQNGTFEQLVHSISKSIEGFEYYFSDYWSFITNDDISITSITYVDTQKFPDKIRSSLIVFLLEYYNQIQTKKIFGLDECWRDLLVNSFFVEELARTVRKNDGSFQSITQSLKDFENSIVGSTVYNLSVNRFHFKDESIPEDMHPEDAALIRNLKSVKGGYSEFLYKNGSIRKVLRYPMTPLEYELFSTTKEDVQAFESFWVKYKDFFSFKEVMDRWVDFKYYYGRDYEH